MFYSVVLLDGNELHCLSLEEVQNLFFTRQINQDSLVCSAEEGKWQMLKRTFDVSQWIPAGAPPAQFGQHNFEPPNNTFAGEQPSAHQPPANQIQPPVSPSATTPPPVTFNQFPPNPPSQSNNPFAQNSANGYSQNNQTETYYQADTNQTNYNFQNNQSAFAPSKYNNAGAAYDYTPNYAHNPTDHTGRRPGLRTAAVFLLFNALFYLGFIIFGAALSNSVPENGSEAFNTGRKTGAFLPLIIDLILAIKLWKIGDGESARKSGLVLSYFVFVVFCLIFPVISFNAGEIFVGTFVLVSSFFYFTSLALVLHGKENPSQSRVVMGIASFAIYFLVMFGVISMSVIGKMAPNIAKLNIKNAQIEKYKIEGKEFEDKTTGAKVVLPEGWSMIKLDNPIINSPEARMIAIDKAGNRLTMLEVVPVPGNLDLKRQNSSFILDQLADGVVEGLKEEVKINGGFGKNSVNEVTRLSIFIGKHPAKLLVFDKTTGGEKDKGHLIITYDELTFYVLHSWCPAAEYDQAQNEFTFFEKNFSVPDKINSAFTQTAENDKKDKTR